MEITLVYCLKMKINYSRVNKTIKVKELLWNNKIKTLLQVHKWPTCKLQAVRKNNKKAIVNLIQTHLEETKMKVAYTFLS